MRSAPEQDTLSIKRRCAVAEAFSESQVAFRKLRQAISVMSHWFRLSQVRISRSTSSGSITWLKIIESDHITKRGRCTVRITHDTKQRRGWMLGVKQKFEGEVPPDAAESNHSTTGHTSKWSSLFILPDISLALRRLSRSFIASSRYEVQSPGQSFRRSVRVRSGAIDSIMTVCITERMVISKFGSKISTTTSRRQRRLRN